MEQESTTRDDVTAVYKHTKKTYEQLEAELEGANRQIAELAGMLLDTSEVDAARKRCTELEKVIAELWDAASDPGGFCLRTCKYGNLCKVPPVDRMSIENKCVWVARMHKRIVAMGIFGKG